MVLWNVIYEKILFISAERVKAGLHKNWRNETCWMRKVKIWMSLVPEKRKDEQGFSLYSWSKTYEKASWSEMNSDSFLKKSGLPKLQIEGRAKTFARSKIQDFSTCYFPTTLITYSMGEGDMFFSDTSKYSRINLVQKVLWLSAFLYHPHTCSIARILLLSWSLKLNACPRWRILPLSGISDLITLNT